MSKIDQIILAGMKLFVIQGFEKTPTSQISKEAKVGTGTLFFHFKSKEDLINEIYIYIKNNMSSYIFKRARKESNTKKQLQLIWTDFIKWGFENSLQSFFLRHVVILRFMRVLIFFRSSL